MALNGIDIADWQRGINLSKVQYDFCIVKANEGTKGNYSTLHEQADAVLKNGKLLGLYHFARTGDAVAQADVFIREIQQYVGKAALFLDWENAGNYDTTVLRQGPAWAKKWLDRVKEKTGVTPLIYTSRSVCSEYDWSSVAKTYGLWMAQYANMNRVNGYQSSPWTSNGNAGAWGRNWKLHQYTGNGYLSGYSGALDLDIFYGTKADWQEMCSVADTKTDATSSSSAASPNVNYYTLALDVVKGKYGTGATRKKKLGAKYTKVQNIVNKAYSMVDDVIAGKYGNGSARKKKLGSYYNIVQYLVNQKLK